jgi:site-specific recombinase XerD
MTRHFSNKPAARPTEVLQRDEVSRFLAEAVRFDGPTSLRRCAMAVVMWRAGLRVSEVLDLVPSDLDESACTILVQHGKGSKKTGGKRRHAAMTEETSWECVNKWLEWWRQQNFPAGTPLFCTLAGKRMHRNSVGRMVKRLAEKAKIDKRVHPHVLRHTHAYELTKEGVATTIIQKQLGHASLITTQIYLDHIMPQDVVERLKGREW